MAVPQSRKRKRSEKPEGSSFRRETDSATARDCGTTDWHSQTLSFGMRQEGGGINEEGGKAGKADQQIKYLECLVLVPMKIDNRSLAS
jgi:hypothetical protein